MVFAEATQHLRKKSYRTENYSGYQKLHKWIVKQLGGASYCSNDPSHIAPRYHWANISGEYKWDISDFRSLCPSCHVKMDYTDEHRKLNAIIKRGNGAHNTSVVQIDDARQVSVLYRSIKQASQATKIHHNSISNTVTHRAKTAGGFRWCYKGAYFGL